MSRTGFNLHSTVAQVGPHRRAAVAVVIALAINIGTADVDAQTKLRRRFARPATGGGSALLTFSDWSLDGCWTGPDVEGGGGTVNYPTAPRVIGGVVNFYQLDGKLNVYQYPAATPGPCTASIASMNQAAISQSWGAFPAMHSSDGGGPANQYAPHHPGLGANSYVWGLKWDEATSWLVASHAPTYNTLPTGANAIVAATLNTGSHTLSCAGEWGITGVIQSAVGTGLIDIPATFLSTYGLGSKRWGVGTGGYTSSVSNGPTANSMGLAIRATDVPSGNACPNNTDTAVAEGTTLVRHDTNETGPNSSGADNDLSGLYIGSNYPSPNVGTPPENVNPTTPHPQQTAWNKYSYAYYRHSWDPWTGSPCKNGGSCGFVGGGSFIRSDWYSGSVKSGIVSLISMPSGFMNDLVDSSPVPTVSGCPSSCVVTFKPSGGLSTHFGVSIQIGDKGWVQTCTPITPIGDPLTGCDGQNGQYLSIFEVTAVNTGTGVVTGALHGTDSTSGTHTPIVGGRIYMGGLYAYGAPDTSRNVDLVQILDPAQLGEVAGGTRDRWNVIYNQEVELSAYAAPFGCPGCAVPGKNPILRQDPSAVHAVGSIHKIYLVFRNAQVSGVTRSLFMQFTVVE